jgi:hypothetical protein
LSFITVSRTIFTRALHLPERFRHPIYRRVLPVLKLDPVTLIGIILTGRSTDDLSRKIRFSF